MRPGDGVEELILTLLVSDYQLAVGMRHSASFSLAANKTTGSCA